MEATDEIPVKKRLLWIITSGIPSSFYYIVVYVYFLPLLFSNIFSSIGAPLEEATTGQILGYGVIFLILSVAASVLRGTIYKPILKSLSHILAFYILLSLMNKGRLEGEIFSETGRITVYLDISPIIYIIFAFLTVPGIILPFYNYYTKEIG